MDNNGKDNKNNRHIDRRMKLVRNVKECNFHKKMWCEGGLQLKDILTNNVREYELNPRLRYDMVRLENWQNNCIRGLIGYRTILRKICYE